MLHLHHHQHKSRRKKITPKKGVFQSRKIQSKIMNAKAGKIITKTNLGCHRGTK
jgi:hypothetical protein